MKLIECIDDACKEMLGREFVTENKSQAQKIRALMELCFLYDGENTHLAKLVKVSLRAIDNLNQEYNKISDKWFDKVKVEPTTTDTNSEIEVDTDALAAAWITLQEDLVWRRDSRISQVCSNGLCIKEFDGSPSNVIRISTRLTVEIAVKTYLKYINAGKPICGTCGLPKVKGCCNVPPY